jgi:hypothetical protein
MPATLFMAKPFARLGLDVIRYLYVKPDTRFGCPQNSFLGVTCGNRSARDLPGGAACQG